MINSSQKSRKSLKIKAFFVGLDFQTYIYYTDNKYGIVSPYPYREGFAETAHYKPSERRHDMVTIPMMIAMMIAGFLRFLCGPASQGFDCPVCGQALPMQVPLVHICHR